MNQLRALLIVFLVNLLSITPLLAGDFNWLNNLKVRAQADSSGFRMQLATRFHLGSAEVNAIIGSVESPADAYMVLRLGEMSHKPIQQVLHVYSTGKNRGWGVMAKQLGIKPGSRDFHALKRGHDLYRNDQHGGPAGHANKGNSKVKHASHHKEKGKGKWK